MTHRPHPGFRWWPGLLAAQVIVLAALVVAGRRPAAPSLVAEASASEPALAREVQRLRVQLAAAELRLAVACPAASAAPAREAATAIEIDSSPPPVVADHRPSPAPVDRTMARIEAAQAAEPLDAQWAAQAETRLRELAGALGAAASIERVACTRTLCRLELAHAAGPFPEKPLAALLSGAESLMPQAEVQPDERAGHTTVVFARAGADLPDSEGGGS